MGKEIILWSNDYTDILLKLQEYKKERKLTSQMQLDGLLSNILEELTEYTRADTNDELIDALCDIIVFSLNATEYTDDLEATNWVVPNVVIENFYKYRDKCKFGKLAMKAINKFTNKSVDLTCVSKYKKFITVCFYLIYDLGYDPYKCMLETIKEISSRKGKWDDRIKKYVKSHGAYSVKDAIERTKSYSYLITDVVLVKEDDNFYYVKCKTPGDGDDVIERDAVYCKWYKANYENCKLYN